MANKKFGLGMLVLIMVFGMTVVGCKSTPVGMGLMPNDEYATVTINRNSAYQGSAVKFSIFVDNQKVGFVGNGSATKLLVKNGTHSIYTEAGRMQSPVLTFTANSNQLEFTTYIAMGFLKNTLELIPNGVY